MECRLPGAGSEYVAAAGVFEEGISLDAASYSLPSFLDIHSAAQTIIEFQYDASRGSVG
jgi:hypothetical protein